MATVKVKFGGRQLKLRPSSMTTSNLAMIFKLDLTRGIYLNCEEEGEIILPSDEGNGVFEVENLEKTYIVNGDVADTRAPGTTVTSPNDLSRPRPTHISPIGLPLSYQPATARTSLNPPPCGLQINSRHSLQRPRFTSIANSTSKTLAGWKKSFTLIEVNRGGDVTEKYQIHLSLNENNASVTGIENLLRAQLGYDVKLLDAKYLPVMPCESTTGSQFWRSNRKIVAIRENQVANIRRKSNATKKRKPGDILEQLKRLVSDSPDDDFDEPVPLAPISTIRHPTTPSSTVEERAKEMLSKIFNCTICFNKTTLPAAACSSCFSVIGCIPCVEQWYEATTSNNAKCPLCRTNRMYNIIPIMRDFALLLGQPLPEEQNQVNVHSDDDSLDTIPYGDDETLRNVDDDVDDELPVGLGE